jgi:hypothetical protein
VRTTASFFLILHICPTGWRNGSVCGGRAPTAEVAPDSLFLKIQILVNNRCVDGGLVRSRADTTDWVLLQRES